MQLSFQLFYSVFFCKAGLGCYMCYTCCLISMLTHPLPIIFFLFTAHKSNMTCCPVVCDISTSVSILPN